jgi:hypothetical protein
MAALVTEFVAVLTVLFNFVKLNLIPVDVASINIIHVAIWLPVTIGLVKLTIGMVKGFWSSRAKA